MNTNYITNKVLNELDKEIKIERITKKVMTAINELVCNEKWITIHPHGDTEDKDGNKDYRRIKLEDGETPKEAIERVYKTDIKQKNYTEKKEYTSKIRELTKSRYDKKQEYEKLEKENTKLKNAYRKLQRSQWILNSSDAVVSEEEIDKAQKKYHDKWDEKNNAVKEYNNINRNLNNTQKEYLEKYKKSPEQIKKAINNYNPKEIIKGIEQINKDFDYEKLKQDEAEISKKISEKKDEWLNYLNSSKDAQEQEQRQKEYKKWYFENDLSKKQKELWDKMSNFKTERAKAISKVLQYNNGGEFNMTTTKGGVLTSKVEETNKLLSGVVNKDYLPDFSPVAKGFNGNRAFNSGNIIQLNSLDSIFTSIHESMHWLEGVNPDMLANSKAFLEYRTQDDTTKALREITKNKSYGWNEKAKADKFFSPYCGKEYETASEIMSMGVQQLFEHPDTFLKNDIEYCKFVIGNLRGEL